MHATSQPRLLLPTESGPLLPTASTAVTVSLQRASAEQPIHSLYSEASWRGHEAGGHSHELVVAQDPAGQERAWRGEVKGGGKCRPMGRPAFSQVGGPPPLPLPAKRSLDPAGKAASPAVLPFCGCQGVRKGGVQGGGTDSWCREGMEANPVGMVSLRLFDDRSLGGQEGRQWYFCWQSSIAKCSFSHEGERARSTEPKRAA